jgi:hypothetical protein
MESESLGCVLTPKLLLRNCPFLIILVLWLFEIEWKEVNSDCEWLSSGAACFGFPHFRLGSLVPDLAVREEGGFVDSELLRVGSSGSHLEELVGRRRGGWRLRGDWTMEFESAGMFYLSGWKLELAAHWIMCLSLRTLLICLPLGSLAALTVVNFISFIKTPFGKLAITDHFLGGRGKAVKEPSL